MIIIQCISLIIGASTHIKWIVENGIFTRNVNHPFISTLFWDSLAFFDIAGTLLLIIQPKRGLFLTLIIITVDVIHNNSLLIMYNQHINYIGFQTWVMKYWMLVMQLIFMIFVILTFKNNLKEIKYKEAIEKVD